MVQDWGEPRWPQDATCAVSLSYDGADPGHTEIVLPILDRSGIAATFYVPPLALLDHGPEWCRAVDRGHEIGSHSLYSYALEDGSLPGWTLDMVETDLSMTRDLFSQVLPQSGPISFAYPGLDTQCADGDYRSVVAKHHPWARSEHQGINHPVFCDSVNLRCTWVKDFGDEAFAAIDEALETGGWAILAFEGIGGGRRACDVFTHTEILRRLLMERTKIWIAPLREVAMIAETQKPEVRVS
jgi:peptidoglycan/xylan/chitin deacetylase (PgdA/CDA1 family)